VVVFLAFRLQDSMTGHFSAHEALDVVEAVLLAQLMTGGFLFTLTRLDGIARSVPLYHGLLLAGVVHRKCSQPWSGFSAAALFASNHRRAQ
jgi:hypothetical protein